MSGLAGLTPRSRIHANRWFTTFEDMDTNLAQTKAFLEQFATFTSEGHTHAAQAAQTAAQQGNRTAGTPGQPSSSTGTR